MTTRAETIRLAVFDVIKAGAAASEALLPTPHRNRSLDEGLEQLANGANTWLNLIDGGRPELLGEETGAGEGAGLKEYDLPVRFEWIVQHPDSVRREQVYDAGLERLGALLRADRTLGGVCDDLDIDAPDSADTVLAGVPQFKSCEFVVRFLFSTPDFLA